jgi:hypothetical protein
LTKLFGLRPHVRQLERFDWGLWVDFSAGTPVAGSEDQEDNKDRDAKPVHAPDFNNLLSLCDWRQLRNLLSVQESGGPGDRRIITGFG